MRQIGKFHGSQKKIVVKTQKSRKRRMFDIVHSCATYWLLRLSLTSVVLLPLSIRSIGSVFFRLLSSSPFSFFLVQTPVLRSSSLWFINFFCTHRCVFIKLNGAEEKTLNLYFFRSVAHPKRKCACSAHIINMISKWAMKETAQRQKNNKTTQCQHTRSSKTRWQRYNCSKRREAQRKWVVRKKRKPDEKWIFVVITQK